MMLFRETGEGREVLYKSLGKPLERHRGFRNPLKFFNRYESVGYAERVAL
jgi:hypothetical protein